MAQTICYPNGARKACVLSYDDGTTQDKRLIGLLDQYGVRCTFNLNAGLMGTAFTHGSTGLRCERISAEDAARIYQGREIGGHSLHHPSLPGLLDDDALLEIAQDKCRLEKLCLIPPPRPLRSFAYPYGAYNQATKKLLKRTGYQNARTIAPTHSFDIPADFLEWNPTCHHKDPALMELARTFCGAVPPADALWIFLLWGHSYEFDAYDQWNLIETFAAFMAKHRDEIWFTTCGDLCAFLSPPVPARSASLADRSREQICKEEFL
jgi:hypothetical protein